jgi:hypothetical protein
MERSPDRGSVRSDAGIAEPRPDEVSEIPGGSGLRGEELTGAGLTGDV